jgi:hypothetical protein
MARPVGSGAIVEVVFEQQEVNQSVLNVFHYRLNNDTGLIVDGDAITQQIANWVLIGLGNVPALIKPAFNNQWQFLRLRTQWIYPTRYTPLSYSSGAGPGTNVNPALPQNCATTITKRGLLADRHSIGSSHWAGMTTADLDAGVMTAGRLATMVGIADKMLVTIDTSAVPGSIDVVPIIYNRTTPAASLNVVDYVVQSTSRTMRRRTVQVGV